MESYLDILLYVKRGLWYLNASFNYISVISWRSVLLEEETGVPGENHRPGQLLIKGTLSGSLMCPLYTKDRRGHNSMIVEFPMQSVPITTKVVRSNPAHNEVHSI
jgi:hypothetical protein